ncbi:hypothetical protein FN846DRAFT_894355 [Sphaerosporella brunnea]|uniref:Uncharacterized protein n=1 Tax=Sphaerosporella brunnea TaxID=1250544 RepID=A0A5J5EKK2_9PEZI|nr:hypothetical protein FN846DRAFT_894355 [Sphaerosporella brunnea]
MSLSFPAKFPPLPAGFQGCAGQKCGEPAPEFSLISPFSGMVSNLSDAESYSLTHILPETSALVRGAPQGVPTYLHLHHKQAFSTRTFACILGACFKTGRLGQSRQHPSRSAGLGPMWL